MGHLGPMSLHHVRSGPICAVLLAAFLAVTLGAISFVPLASVGAPPLSHSLVSGDGDANALRPQQQLAIRGSSRSVRLGSSGDFGVIRALARGAQPPPRSDGYVAQGSPAP